MKPGKTIKTKGRCCKSRPRCDRCPVVLCRLEAQGFVQRSRRTASSCSSKVKKKQLKAVQA